MAALGQDVRYGLRQLRRSPGFAIAAALTLALGISATTTVFSFVDAVLLRPLPYPHPERLVVAWNERQEKTKETLSYPNFLDFQRRATAFEYMAVYHRRRFNVAAAGAPERVQGAAVSLQFFRTLGVAPVRGRDFAAGEDQPGRDQVVVVSDRFWRQQLGGDSAAVGRHVRVDGVPLTVIGVIPSALGFPAATDLWIPISREAKWLIESRGLQGYTALARLRSGATQAQAQDQMATIAASLAAEYPRDNEGWTLRLESFQHALAGDLRPTLLLLFGSAAVLLLVAAVNLANMLLARAAGRQREMALRRAVGAGTGRLVRQLLTENLVLAGVGGALGVLGAVWGVDLWRAAWTDPSGSPAQAGVDWRVVVFALTTTVATALLFGLAPALRITRAGLSDMLRGATTTSRLRPMGRVLVAGEIALALLLAIGGSLLVRSLLRLQAVDPGFDAEGVLTARVALPAASYTEPKRVIAFYQEFLREAGALPGVEAAGAAEPVPFTSGSGSYGFAIQGRPAAPVQEWPIADWVSTTPDYFRALRIPLVRGRLLDARDDGESPDVMVINETMARRFWPGQDPVGARLTFEAGQKHWIEVVGVVADVRSQDLGRPAIPQVFVAHAQWGDPALSLAVRTSGDPLALAAPLRAILRRLDPEVPLAEVRTMEQTLAASTVPARLRTAIFGGFATLALVLAAVGIYGVMAYLVSQREREIAVRMALGARRGEVVRGVIAHSLLLAAPGLILGLAGALVAGRALRAFLYQVTPTDPVVLGLAASSVALLVTAAALVPARRAANTDAMAALRAD
jgi:putative ABC transport system permease protein